MNSQDNLLTFLKKQSLFNNSPSRQLNRKRSSRSRDRSNSKDTHINSLTPHQDAKNNSQLQNHINSNSNNNLKGTIQKSNTLQLNYGSLQNNNRAPVHNYAPLHKQSFNFNNKIKQNRQILQTQIRKDSSNPQMTATNNFNYAQSINNNDSKPINTGNNMWSGLVSYSTSFQSARIESQHCLDLLRNKVTHQITNINRKLQNFNHRIMNTLTAQLKNLKEKILMMVEESFKESQKYIREYMLVQEQNLAKDLLVMRQHLQKELVSIDSMREEIGKPNWRKVAGEIIANQIEQKVQEVTKMSSTLQAGKWQLENLVGHRLKNIEKDIKSLVRLKKQ